NITSSLSASATSTNISCKGANDGTGTVTATGGTGAYTYSWAPSGGAGATATGLAAGSYTCTVTDAGGCTSTAVINITDPPLLTTTGTGGAENCSGGSTATVSVSPTGGTGAYTYAWAPSGGTAATSTALPSGSYTCTIKDNKGCTITQVETITDPALLTATGSGSTEACFGASTATATVTPSGGTGAYTYSWAAAGGTGQTTTPLPAGNYTCTITDNKGCSITQVETIAQAANFSATNTQTNILCNGNATGSITVTPSGGTGAYTYSWAPSGGTAATASGLTATGYVCTITDNNGCSITSGATITQPSAIALSSSSTPASCGNADGTASVTATGGTGAYTYSWTPSGGTAATTTPVAAGSYTLTLSDANACVKSIVVTVASNSGPTLVIGSSTNVSCNGGTDGSITSTLAGGTGPFVYSWTPSGGTAPNATGLTAGTYTVGVKDGNGCIAKASTTITEPPAMTFTTASANVTCNGGNNGTISVNPSGGSGPYTYSWSPSGGTSSLATGLTAGSYTCTITDSKACSIAPAVVVTQPTAVTGTATETDVKCNGGSTGTATVTASGGTGTLTYSWSPSGGSGTTASGLSANTYTCTITDSKGCTGTAVTTVKQPPVLAVAATAVSSTCGNANGSVTANASGGSPAYTYSWNPGVASTATVNNLSAATYTITLTDANACQVTATVVLNDMGSPTLTMGAVNQITCFGACNGSATAIASGGTGTLTYSWTPSGGTGATASALCPGTYTCTLNDANGCSKQVSTVITQPPVLAVSIASSANVKCFGGSNGTATASVSGGSGAYTYSWTPSGGTSAIAGGLTAGDYTITVKDANGCSQKDSVIITQPTLLHVSVAGIKTTCMGKCDGTLICIPGGGTPSYTYSWSTGCAAPSCSNVCAGSYSITVTDANGCSASDTTSVKQPSAITLQMFSVNAHCFHSDGMDSVSASGGSGSYTYTWSPGAGSANASYTNIPPGNYVVLVHDVNNCPAKDSLRVLNTPGVVADIVSTTPATCFGGSDGKAGGGGQGGTLPYSYSWSPNTSLSDTAKGLAAGSYTVTVTDGHNCTSTAVATVGQQTEVTIKPMTIVTLCIGQCMPLTATGSGGTPGYTYTWTQGGSPAVSPACPVVSTTYTVVGTDVNGCVSAPDTVSILMHPPIKVIATGDTSVCPGSSVPLHAVASGGNGNFTYTWSTALGLNSTTVQNPIATPSVSTTYTVVAFDNCGTPAASATDTVTIYPTPLVVFAASDTAGCAPFCITFTGLSNPACSSATWNFGDSNGGFGCASQFHCFSAAGKYSVSLNVTDVHGCPGSYNVLNYIDVFPLPKASFTLGPQPTTIVNSEIFFKDHSSGANSWSWNFGDFAGSSSILQNPSYVYPDTGCFVAQLAVTNSYGCVDTTSRPLCIRPDFTFYAPNAFTPNGDGTNDFWQPKGLGIDPATYHLMIFDRWGNLVFETHTWGESWDGRANTGTDIAQTDTFVWKVTLRDYLENKHAFSGICNLIR
ncbi:MAG TPA: gliding motility-associated C-terminal domain-containing protein, partial [Bacteroidia bacterium]|nr:gliding motility-associated C-terminal domain-containing protein [Bacteroidia bacterium]